MKIRKIFADRRTRKIFLSEAIYDGVFDFHRAVLAITNFSVRAIEINNELFRTVEIVDPVD
ncbi:Uncharacterised protein [Vibrio cholerae]|uniref:Uncharacterized protein n=1 Tax=Vibrio cholerae TaxID=666 RepID=A0A655TCF7_VIBCL|nr:Uncharacterised protein [Vibrio cholerae]CSA55722.1 Uncharacterised protein [Vibrio cholerae]CSA56592.1 Uncharacterised protein [Vibrio cholerae]CSA61568.1 Uncharacterised protein [Vibrio cholerae]CSA70708.1 Uncharacterised protein [Vibrio cholerae]